MISNKILGITIFPETKIDILEKIKKDIGHLTYFLHIVSLNPENLVLTSENSIFKKIVETAQIKLIDGIGVVLAARWLGVQVGERVTGVMMMDELMELAGKMRLTVLLIGGKPDLALSLSKCQQEKYLEAKFIGLEGIKDIKNPQAEEEEAIFSIVRTAKPNIIIVAFGSPEQEIWLDRHSNKFAGIIGIGVGGAFDYFSKNIPQAPLFIRRIGLEWLFRLFVQPWRWRRQLRLIKFIWLIIGQKFGKRNS